MLLATYRKRERNGATAVELAAVIVVFSMLMFRHPGILHDRLHDERRRNGAREGARYAVVNSSDTTVVTDTQAYVLSLMDGLNVTDAPYACNIYLADSTGANIGSAGNAQFGQYICCDVSVTYVPMTPGLLYLKTIVIRSKCSMISEAN